MLKIKGSDEVIVIAGRDKGKRGKVMRILGNDLLIVSGINMVKKHTKPNPQAQQPGGIVEKEATIALSNVAIFNPATGKGDRVGFKMIEVDEEVEKEDGTKVLTKVLKKFRFFKSNGEVVGK